METIVWFTLASVKSQVHSRDDKNRLVVTLFQEEDATSVSELLLQEGLARVSKTEARKVDVKLARGVRGADKEKVCLAAYRCRLLYSIINLRSFAC